MALSLSDTVLTGSLTVRDSIAWRLYSVAAWANLPTDKQDAVMMAGSEALTEIEQFADWVQRAGSGDNAPAAWASWLVALTVRKLSYNAHPERQAGIEREEASAYQRAVTNFQRVEIDYTPSAGVEAFANTVIAIRQFVVGACVSGSWNIKPPPTIVDAAIEAVTNDVWNRGGWSYRRRLVTFTATSATPSVVTFTAGLNSGETFDSFATFAAYLTTSGYEGRMMRWANPDAMAAYKADTTASTGVPEYFRVEFLWAAGSPTLLWHFHPHPDATYTFKAEVLVRTPAVPALTSDVPFTKFPSEFQPVMKRLVLAQVLEDLGAEGSEGFVNKIRAEADAMLTQYSDIGKPDENQSVRDVNGDIRAMTGDNSMLGGGM